MTLLEFTSAHIVLGQRLTNADEQPCIVCRIAGPRDKR